MLPPSGGPISTEGETPSRGALTVARETDTRRSLPRQQVLYLASQVDPTQHFFAYVPGTGGHGAPVFVTVHGLSRNAHEHASLFSSHCEDVGAVLVAPCFDEQSKDFQRLGRSGRGTRADAALDAMLEEVSWMTGAVTTRIHLFGFSGGAQFAHRYAMAYPHRIARAVIAAAGWYTFPDPKERYPYGIRRSRELPDVHFDPEEFLQVAITVMVGDQDTTNVDLRITERVNRQQGENRLERAQNWVSAMRAAADAYHLDPRVTYESIPNGDHSFGTLMRERGLGERVFAALFGAPATRVQGADHG